MPVTLGVDVDDVCADFMTHTVLSLGVPERWGIYDINKLYPMVGKRGMKKYLNDPENYSNLDPMPGAIPNLKELRRAGIILEYITARDKSLKDITLAWLRKFYFPTPSNLVMTSGHDEKIDYLRERGLWGLVEDRGATLLSASSFIPYLYLFDRPWNRGFSSQPRMLTWNHIRVSVLRDYDVSRK